MTDILIRDVPENVVAALEAHATRLGLSRSEYIRRQWAQDARRTAQPVTSADFAAFAERHTGLSDPGVMNSAWQ